MKQFISYLGASLAAIAALASCNKEIEAPVEDFKGGVPFEICASAVDTKTAINNDLATSWVANDAINLFHAEAGSTTSYTSDGQFTITAETLEDKKFKGNLAAPLEVGSYDWYAFYPYSKYNKTPAGSSQSDFGFTTIGGTSQTQTGNNSTAHLCGKPCPLYGIKTGVASNVAPSIAMNHLTSIIEVNVTNNSGKDLTVTSVSFTGTEDIVGTYYIDFTQNPVVYTSSGESYVSNTASLSVTDGEAIANGNSATFYVAIKPFTATNGQTLKVSVNGYEKDIPLTQDVSFTAGKIKKINFAYNYVPTLDTFTAINDISKLSDGASLLIVGKSGDKYYQLPVNPTVSSGKVAGVEVAVTDNTIQADATSAWKATKSGDYWQLSSSGKNIYHSKGGVSGTDLAYGTSTAYPWRITNHSSENRTFKLAGVVYTNGVPAVKTRGMLMSGTTFGGYALTNIDASGYSAIMLFVKEEAPSTDPAIIANDITEISARGESAAVLTYSIENPIEGTSVSATCDGTIVTEVVEDGNNFLYSVSANTTTSSREGSITLTYGDLTKIIKVSQLAPVFKVSRTEVELEAAATSSSTITVTSDFNWTSVISTGAGFTSTPTTCEWSAENPFTDGKTTVTITANAPNASEEGTKTLGTLTFTNMETSETLVVTVKQKSSAIVSGEALPFSFDSGKNDITSNMTQSGLGSDYKSAPKLKFDTANDYLTVKIASAASSISILLKQNGTGTTAEFTIYGSIDGTNYTSIQVFSVNPGNGKTMTATVTEPINSAYRYIKFEYTTKPSSTNIAAGSISIK